MPGVTGRDVTELLVSRDGSRLVAVVRGRKADSVVSNRIRHDMAGGILGFTPLQRIPLPEEGSTRIRDIGWRSPTSVSVLSDINDDARRRSARSRSTGRRARSWSPGPTRSARSDQDARVPHRSTAARCWASAGDHREPDTSRPDHADAARGPDRAHLRRLIHRPAPPVAGVRRAAAGMVACSMRPSTCSSGAAASAATSPDGCSARACRAALSTGRTSRGRRRSRPGWWRRGRPRRTTAPSARSSWATRTAASGATGGCSATSWPPRCWARPPGLDPDVPVLLVPVPSRPGAGRPRGYEATAALVRTAARHGPPRASRGGRAAARVARRGGPEGTGRRGPGRQRQPLDALSRRRRWRGSVAAGRGATWSSATTS